MGQLQNVAIATATPQPQDSSNVAQYLPMVQKTARKMARRLPPHVVVEDLVSAGVVGLLEAFARFDASRCDCFEAYAAFRVRGAMLDEMRRSDLMARDARTASRQREETASRLEASLGRQPREQEVAAALGQSVEDYRGQQGRLTGVKVVPLESLCDDGPRDGGIDVVDLCDQHEALLRLRRALSELPERQRLVLRLHYEKAMTLREIGGIIGTTESRVCQIHAEAVHRLRAALCDPDGLAAAGGHAGYRISKTRKLSTSKSPS
jgi:RNA polymerase sigma factor for flagellar operon FliA